MHQYLARLRSVQVRSSAGSFWLPAIVLLIVAISTGTARAQELCRDPAVKIDEQDTGSEVHVFATMNGLLEATLTLRAQLKGMSSANALPLTVCLNTPGRIPVATFRRDSSPWSYKYDYAWQKGLMDYNSSLAGQYVVCAPPFPVGTAYPVNQGFFGSKSHKRGSDQQYAVDFGLPEGTVVCAASAGTVIGVRADSSMGGNDTRFTHCGNYVIVKHRDGTYAEYVHLQPGSARVRPGQQVAVGTPIALSGHTGYADAPHLHFAVYKVRSGEQKVTLPVYFQTRAGVWTPKEHAVLQNN